MSVIRSVHESRVWHTVDEWLKERSELAVDVYYPRSGGSGTWYFVFIMQQFQQLVMEANTRFRWVYPAMITVIMEKRIRLIEEAGEVEAERQ